MKPPRPPSAPRPASAGGVRYGRQKVSGTRTIQHSTYATASAQSSGKYAWWDLLKQLAKRSGGRCEADDGGRRCSHKAVDGHHIRKLRDGGTNTLNNLLHLCLGHHEKRHNHLYRAGYGNKGTNK